MQLQSDRFLPECAGFGKKQKKAPVACAAEEGINFYEVKYNSFHDGVIIGFTSQTSAARARGNNITRKTLLYHKISNP